MKTVLNCIGKMERDGLCINIGRLIGKLHAHGIVHGDLTTSNMIINPEGKIVLVDFGLGKRRTSWRLRESTCA